MKKVINKRGQERMTFRRVIDKLRIRRKESIMLNSVNLQTPKRSKGERKE
jgi:hypothetical protein